MANDFGKLMPQMADVAFGPVAISGILGVTILLWVTDSWHGIAPAWVALRAALICALPVVGVIPFSDLPQKVNIAPIFFVSGVIGFGAVVFHSGINAWAGVYLVTMFMKQTFPAIRQYLPLWPQSDHWWRCVQRFRLRQV
ncbi:hypothetical protein [Ruegeria arenilitoris]|uniref:hypothetical protein n=1 Tax=Ruegeria arenilitoris TaxID=1173585 RepID=UPI00147B2217|nr:hypothetical protein [Ruegeria arenilitoris]